MIERNYEDILNIKWPRNSNRIKMNLNQRAKIFLPFAALTGFDRSIENKQREVEARIEGKNKPKSIIFEDIQEIESTSGICETERLIL